VIGLRETPTISVISGRRSGQNIQAAHPISKHADLKDFVYFEEKVCSIEVLPERILIIYCLVHDCLHSDHPGHEDPAETCILGEHKELLNYYGYNQHKYQHDYVYHCKVHEPDNLLTNINKLLEERRNIYSGKDSLLTTVIIHGAEQQRGLKMGKSPKPGNISQDVKMLLEQSYDHKHHFNVIETPASLPCESLKNCEDGDLMAWADKSSLQRDLFGYYTGKYNDYIDFTSY
jgi:hypothetical protein